MTLSHYIVAITGVGYLVVGIQQLFHKNIGGAMMWVGYSFANAGAYLMLK